MSATAAYSPPCTLEVRTLPSGATTRLGYPFRFSVSERGGQLTIQVPGRFRGPDNCDPDEDEQVRWLGSHGPDLRTQQGCVWSGKLDVLPRMVALLKPHLLAPTGAAMEALTEVRLLRISDPAAALALADELLLDEPDWAELHFERGQIFAGDSDYATARTCFDRCIEVDPMHGLGWQNAGFTRVFDESRWAEGLQMAKRAAELLPRSSSAGYYYARQLARMKEFEAAAAEMARTITLDDNTPPDLYMHLARWQHALGRGDDALATLDASQRQPPSLLKLREELAG